MPNSEELKHGLKLHTLYGEFEELQNLIPKVQMPKYIWVFSLAEFKRGNIDTSVNGIYYAGNIDYCETCDVQQIMYDTLQALYASGTEYLAGSKTAEVIKNIRNLVKPMTNAERDYLYQNNVNPLIILPQVGPVVWGQTVVYNNVEYIQSIKTITELVVVRAVQEFVKVIYKRAFAYFQYMPLDKTLKQIFKYTICGLLERLTQRFVHTRMVFDLQWCVQDVTDQPDLDFNIIFKIHSTGRGANPIDMIYNPLTGFDSYNDLDSYFI